MGDMEVDEAALQREFTEKVHRCFDTLRARGMAPNEACALALKVASGVAPLPYTTQEVAEKLREATSSSAEDDLISVVGQLLSSPDAMFSAFWPAPDSNPAEIAPDSSSNCSSSSSRPEGQQLAGPSHTAAATAAGSIGSSNQQPAAAAGPSSQTLDGVQPSQQQQPRDSSQHAASNRQSSSSSSDSIHLEAVHALHQSIASCRAPGVHEAAVKACSKLVDHIATSSGCNLHNPGLLRQVTMLLLNPLLEEPEHHWLVGQMCQVLVALPPVPKQEVQQLLASWQAQDMRVLLITLQQYITVTLYSQRQLSSGVAAATQLLGMLSAANDLVGDLDHTEFYNDALNNEDFNVKEDYRRWKVGGPGSFSFCDYSFMYDPASKAHIMRLENACTQYQEFESSIVQSLLSNGAMTPYFVLRVRRGPSLLGDTLLQVNNAKKDGSLRKPLKVKFIGEEGVDEGGVQKEFFQLLVRQCFNPDFGMFTHDEQRNLHWFRTSRLLELENEYELIGILLGLAIYNGHILEFQFPMVLYKKLLELPLTLSDLAELQPEVHHSLQLLLGMEPQQVEALDLTFQVDMEVGFGEVEAVELLPGGASCKLTAANRQLYVSLYTCHLLESSIELQFGAFKRGFYRLCSGAALKMFRPPELEALVCGGRVLDMEALQGATHYDDGYTATHTVIQWFWQVVHEFSEHQKKRLLFFITGSDRVPIKGLAHIAPPFVISRNGPHSERLPTAHTCFNHLLLPAYDSKQTLRQRLRLAIENAEGFGLL